MEALLNTKVTMPISDPWELGEVLKWEAFDAEVVLASDDNLLIRLLDPFFIKERTVNFSSLPLAIKEITLKNSVTEKHFFVD